MITPPVVPNDAADDRKTAGPGAAKAPARRRIDLLPTLLAAALLVSVLTLLFELLRQTLFPQIGFWRSHSTMIIFSVTIATVLAWFMLRANQRAQEQLRQLSRAVEQSPLTIVITNPAGEIEYVNRHFTETTGYSAAEARGQNPRILKSGETPPEEYAHLWQTITAGKDWHGEFHNRKKNGELYWERAAISPIFDDAGNITHFLAFKEDITERKQMQRQLAETVDFNSTIISDVPAGIIVFKASGECMTVNEAAARIIQGTVPQVLKQNFRQLESWRACGLLETAERTLATREPQQEEFHFVSTFGKEVWVAGHFSCFVRNHEPHLLLTLNDITERKRAEETLAQERALLRTLIDNVPDCIYAKDAAGRKILANPADLKNLRCQTEAEAIGKTDFDFFPREIAEKFHADDQKVIQGKPVINREEYVLNEEGEKRWLMTSKLPLRDQNGKIVGLVGIGRDITERKKTEDQLRQSEGHLAEAQRAAKLGSWYLDIATNAVSWSDELYRIFDVEKTAFGGTYEAFLSRVHAEDRSRILQANAEAKASGKSFELEYRVLTRTGELKIVQEMGYGVKDAAGKIAGLFGTAQDITDRKRAEEKIHEQAALLDETSDAIWVMGSNERISYWNKGAERIYGWTTAEAIGKNPVELLFKGTMTPQLRECIKAVNERGEWAGELEEFTKDGKTVIIQGRSNVIRDEQGRRKSVLIINSDITEKKKLEEQFLRSQRMESIGAVAGGIAHDLNNVLTPLLFSVQILKEKITDADGQKLLDALEANVLRGAKLVKQVLTFGRGVQGERIPVQAVHIVREVGQIIHETFPKSVEFEYHSPVGLWTVTGDSTQLHQVLLNLCVNARDAMPNGGKLSIRLKNVVLNEIYAGMNPESKPGPFVIIEVTDTGAGIPKEIQDRIFDPFFTTKKPGEGTGLGLSTTLGIVKSHGGFINCYSEPGKGSTFKVYLPANAAPADAENLATEQTKLPRGHDELVLLVDDEEAIREVSQKTLERFGYRVLLAANGAEAVSLYAARRDDIAVVVTDMAMPILDGPAAIVALQSINPEVKIIGSSGLDSAHGAKTNGYGIGHFIPKPYSTEAMIRALHKVLHGTAAQSSARQQWRNARLLPL